ncbi:MAG: gliding motility protein GldM [Bacteroidota bacterium]
MGLPKEPRQKMINLMYLVLTALLALNVSNEILNAFKTVNTSLTNANNVIDDKNSLIFQSLDAKLKDPQTAEKAAMWKPVADQAKTIGDDFQKYIEDLKLELKKQSGLEMIEGQESFKEDNLDAPTRYLAEGPKGEELKKKLEDVKAKLLDIVGKSPNPSQKAIFEKQFPINTEIPKGLQNKEFKNWQNVYFHMTPTIAALTMLTKFENDVKNSEAQVVQYAHDQIGAVKIVYDKFQALVGTNSTYLLPGQELIVTAGIGAYSAAAKPTIVVNRSTQTLNADGVAEYKTTVNSVGNGSINVNIKYFDPQGKQLEVIKKIDYTVGQPGSATVTPDKMNVFYREVINPVTVSGGSVGLEKVNVTMTNGTITKVSPGKYEVNPGNGPEAIVTVQAEKSSTPFKFRVKDIPNPLAMVGEKNGGTIPTAAFKAQGGLRAVLENFDFAASFTIVSYKLGGQGRGIGEYIDAANTGAPWSGAAKSIVDKAQPGSAIYFDDIRAKGPTGKERKLSPIFFTLR